jgi:Sulfotransferase family
VALPDFFVIGAPKAGTTALHAALATHPQLFLSSVKEPKFFLCDEQPPPREKGPGDAHSAQEWVWRRDRYEALFDGAPPGALRGESTPFYLSDFRAQRRMREAVPEARLIAVVRDPVDRAYSNWAHLWADGLEPEADFLTACALEDERAAAGWARFWRYRRLGRYGEQLDHLLSLFASEQVHVLRYRELVDAPAAAVDGICAFLGVDEGVVSEVPSANVSTYVPPSPAGRVLQEAVRRGAEVGRFFPPKLWRMASGPLLRALQGGQTRARPDLDPADRDELVAWFADDIDLLGRLTGRPFDDWLADRTGGAFVARRAAGAAASGAAPG